VSVESRKYMCDVLFHELSTLDFSFACCLLLHIHELSTSWQSNLCQKKIFLEFDFDRREENSWCYRIHVILPRYNNIMSFFPIENRSMIILLSKKLAPLGVSIIHLASSHTYLLGCWTTTQ